MNKPDEIVAAEGTELAELGRRRQGRPRGRTDAKPRAARRFSPESVIKAAGEAGFKSVTIDTDGKIRVDMTRPASDAGVDDDKGENEWAAKQREWLDRAGQD